jgi:amino acid transporter
MATQTAAPPTRPADVGLKRDVGLIGAIWSSETSIIGSGWLFGAWYAAQAVGGAALLCWILAGIAIVILALVHAELGGMYPIAGGTARFPHLAFGSVAGISFGFFSWLQAVAVAPIECFAVMQYGHYYWHGIYNPTANGGTGVGNVTGLGLGMTVILMAIFTAINFLAVKLFARVNSTITWWKVIIPVFTIIILLFKMHGSNFSAGGGFIPKGVGWKDIFEAIPGAGIVFAYLGFEQADQLAGEIKNPQKNLPRAIIIAVAIGTAVYILLQVVFIGAMDPKLLAHGFAGITNANVVTGPFAAVASLAALGWLATILRIDAFISPFGTGLMYQTSTSRVGYGLARNRYFPQIFQRTDSHGVPWFSLIFAFIAGLVFLLPFPSWHSLVNLVTSASVLMYAGAPLAMGAFRKQVPEADRPYRMPGAIFFAPVAFVVANLIIYWSGFITVWKLGLCIVIGYVLIGISMAFDPQRPKLNWRAASWLPVYLIGMGLISWMGQYSGSTVPLVPPMNTGDLPFGWDFVAVIGFSLIIYYWAQYVRLPKEEMLSLVEAQAGTTPDPAAH